MSAPAKRYRAFISYSRKDEVWARRIHAGLEAYRAPRGVDAHVDHKTRRLGRIFRDDEEMSACHSLGASIENALADAETLIVICSPDSARSAWVDMEVRRYRTNPNARVLAVIVSGRPNADNPAEECFCPGLRWRVAPDGTLTDVLDEPLAPDVRREGIDRVITRLAAGVLCVSFDHLWRRQGRRTTRKRFGSVLAAASLGLVIAGGMTLVHKTKEIAVNSSALEVATGQLGQARNTGDALLMDSALRLALLAANDPATHEDALTLITETIAATRTQWRFSDLGGVLSHIAYSDDGTTLLALAETGRATMLNMETGRELARVELNGTPIGVAANGSHILVHGADGGMLWRTDNWTATALPVTASVCASFSVSSAALVTCDADGGARLWRTETGNMIQTITNEGPIWTDAKFDASGERILLAAGYGSWSIWDVEDAEIVATTQHSGQNLAWSNPGIYNYFVSGLAAAPYGAVLTPTGVAPLSSHSAPVSAAHLFGDGPARLHVASADADGRLVVSGVAYPITQPSFNMRGHSDAISALAIAPSQKFAATGGQDGLLRVWSLLPLADDLRSSIADNADPISMICSDEADALPMTARQITEEDVTALPALAPLVGNDVCKLPPP